MRSVSVRATKRHKGDPARAVLGLVQERGDLAREWRAGSGRPRHGHCGRSGVPAASIPPSKWPSCQPSATSTGRESPAPVGQQQPPPTPGPDRDGLKAPCGGSLVLRNLFREGYEVFHWLP